MKKILLLISAILSLGIYTCFADGIPPVYEEDFSNGIDSWQTYSVYPQYSDISVKKENDNKYLDINGGINDFNISGVPLELKAWTNEADLSGNYILSMRAKISESYEYAGLIFRSNGGNGYNALVFDVYTKTLCISKDTFYTNSDPTGTRKAYSDLDGYNPFEWNTYKFELNGNSVKIYINGELFIDYTDTDGSKLHNKLGIGAGSMASYYTKNTHIMLDDISVTSVNSIVTGFFEKKADTDKDLFISPLGVSVLPEGFRFTFSTPIAETEITVIDNDGNEIPVSDTEVNGTIVSFKLKKRLSEGRAYNAQIVRIKTEGGDEYTGFSPYGFTCASHSVTVSAQYTDGKLTVTTQTANIRTVKSAYGVILFYDSENKLTDIKAQSFDFPRNRTHTAEYDVSESAKTAVIYTWDSLFGAKMYTSPVTVTIGE